MRDPQGPPGPGRRVPRASIRRASGHRPAPLRRELDQPQLRHLDRPPGGQPRLGRAARRPRVPGRRGSGSGRHDATPLRRAWEEIYIAEGTDWFWWFGDDHSSAQDALFDHLFRKHLQNVYTLLGCDPPGSLFEPISRGAAHRPLHDQPVSFLHVKLDGRAPYFEWIDAARYACGNDRGTMTLVSRGVLRTVWFGFDADRLLIRVDTEGGPARQRLAEVDRLRIGFIDPAETEILVMEPAAPRPVAYLNRPGCPSSNGDTVQVATGSVLELAVPFARIDRTPGDPIRFYVELFQGDASLDRAPREGVLELATPSRDFERILWQV